MRHQGHAPIHRGFITLFGLAIGAVHAGGASAPEPAQEGLQAITPIFSQWVSWRFPSGFHAVNEHATAKSYLFEAVPEGQTADQWSQMITLTGLANAADNEALTPSDILVNLATGFHQTCPDTFAAGRVEAPHLGSYATYAAVISCGQVGNGADSYSETAVVLAIKGAHDFYTVQWAERGPAQSSPLKLTADPWRQKLAHLLPVWLCDKTPGEAAPYTSCHRPDRGAARASTPSADQASLPTASDATEERSAASGFAGTMHYYIGRMASACRPILDEPDTHPKALVDAWQRRADNDLAYRTAVGYETSLMDAAAGTDGEAAAEKSALGRMATIRRKGDDLVRSQLTGGDDDKTKVCRAFEQNVLSGHYDFTRDTPHYQTLMGMARELGLTQ